MTCTVIITDVVLPANEPERDAHAITDTGPRCPTCGTPRPPFNVRLSGILDHALVAKEALSTLVNALEQEVLP